MTVSLAPIAIILLAGGQSKRMGQDKALIPWQGTPLLSRVGEAALQVSTQVYVMSPWSNRYDEILPPSIQHLQEDQPGEGPLSALAQSLRTLSSASWVLLLACDMPQLDAQVLIQWRSQLTSLPQDCLAYVPKLEASRWEPLCGFYRSSCLSSLELFLEQGGRSFQKWLNNIHAIAIPVEPEQISMFHNCNRPEDLTGS